MGDVKYLNNKKTGIPTLHARSCVKSWHTRICMHSRHKAYGFIPFNENASLLTRVREANPASCGSFPTFSGTIQNRPKWKPFGSHRINPMLRKFLTLTAPVTPGIAARHIVHAAHLSSIYAPVWPRAGPLQQGTANSLLSFLIATQRCLNKLLHCQA